MDHKTLGATVELLEAPGQDQAPIHGVALGRVVGFGSQGEVLVYFHGCERGQPISAKTLRPMGEDDAGHEVALMFEGGDACKPVIIGRVEMFSGSVSAVTARPRPVVLSSDDEIVLHCGEAKLSLRKDGRVALRGTYVETRSKGVNRIKGGSVQIN